LLDSVEGDLRELSTMPNGTHVGQLPASMTKDMLPKQFLMKYDYDFLYNLKATIIKLRETARYDDNFLAHSVMQELAIYLFSEEAENLMECMYPSMKAYGIEGLDTWKDWVFDFFDDMDIMTCLYSDEYLNKNNIYHFDHWTEEQFYM
ncbi:MAG: hypothetical protein ACI4L8_04075, partial [Candidatus Fimadaptatus sp.]